MEEKNVRSYTADVRRVNFNNIYLLSDTHMGVRSNSLEWLLNIRNFFFDFYIPYVKSNIKKDDVLFFCGDFFDSRQLLDINVMNAGIDIVIALAEILPVHFLIGNHDIYKKYDTDVNSIAAFRHIPNVSIYEKPVVITNGNNTVFVMPWVGNKEEEERYILANPADYIFAHTDIAGFQYDNNRIISKGIDVSGIPTLKRLFSGHIHKRQEMGKLTYIGCPYQTKRSDIGNVKGVYIFDPKNNSVVFKKNTTSPIFQRVLLEDILELTLAKTSEILVNNYTDIIVPDKYLQIFNLTAFVDVLKDCKYKKIETTIEQKKLDSDLAGVSEDIDIKDVLSLLEMSITDLGYKMEVLVKLKLLNKSYYEKAYNEKDEMNF